MKLSLDEDTLQRLCSSEEEGTTKPNALIFCQLSRVGADCWSFVSVCNVGYGRTVVDMKTRFWDASAWIEQRKIVEQGQEEDFEVIEIEKCCFT